MSHSMTMDMASATTSAAMAAATDHDMESMEDMMGGCKISVCIASLLAPDSTNTKYADALELEHH